jgi:Cdc6-like AAA superfamily ATPase
MDSYHKIAVNPEYLSTNWRPDRVLFRAAEESMLNKALDNEIKTIVIGPFGSGKTSLIKRARESYNRGSIGHAVYVDCSIYQTTYSVLKEILPKSELVFYRSNYELIRELRRYASKNRFTVIFDNFEKLKEKDLILKLMSLGLSVVLVTDSEDALWDLDIKIRSNIPNIIKLEPYTEEQTFEILKRRAEKALSEESYSDEVLREIASHVNGNLTLGINSLKAAAIQAESRGSPTIAESDIDIPSLDIPSNRTDEKVLFDIVKKEKTIKSKPLYDSYAGQVHSPKSMRAYRNYMHSLCSKGLVRAIGDKRGRVYEFVGDNDVHGNNQVL